MDFPVDEETDEVWIGAHVVAKVEKLHTNACKKQLKNMRGGGTDESPFVYRKLLDVLGTIDILHELRPIGVVMARKGRQKLRTIEALFLN